MRFSEFVSAGGGCGYESQTSELETLEPYEISINSHSFKNSSPKSDHHDLSSEELAYAITTSARTNYENKIKHNGNQRDGLSQIDPSSVVMVSLNSDKEMSVQTRGVEVVNYDLVNNAEYTGPVSTTAAETPAWIVPTALAVTTALVVTTLIHPDSSKSSSSGRRCKVPDGAKTKCP